MYVSYVLEFYQVTDNILEFLCMSLIKYVNYLQNLKHKSISNVKSKTGGSCLLMCGIFLLLVSIFVKDS